MDPANAEFAVVDVETTGLFPGRHDRVVEIAVQRVTADGQVTAEFTSLVNPERDMGPTHIHGISARDVAMAPKFHEIAGDVVHVLAGAIFVAHNVSFDARFVRAEMERAEYETPTFPRLCTLQLSRRVEPELSCRKLSAICGALGVAHGNQHEAYGDVCATTRVLVACLARLAPIASWSDVGAIDSESLVEPWPTPPPSGRSYRRGQAASDRASTPSYVSRLIARLPPTAGAPAEIDDYHALVDRVLEDRRVVEEEHDALALLAADIGLSQSRAREAHREYVRGLTQVALNDGVVSEAEREDLVDVCHLLDVSVGELDGIMAAVEKEQGQPGSRVRPSTPDGDLAGKLVCFTGTMTCVRDGAVVERDFAEESASAAGMVVKKNVSKKLDMLVTADPDSQSGKARKAREYGIRIVAEPVFWRMVGIDIH